MSTQSATATSRPSRLAAVELGPYFRHRNHALPTRQT